MKMERYLSYVYKIIKFYFKRTEENIAGAYRTLIPHTHKNPLINSNADPKPTLKILWGKVISKSLQYFFLAQKIGIPITISFGNKYTNTFSQNTNIHPLCGLRHCGWNYKLVKSFRS